MEQSELVRLKTMKENLEESIRLLFSKRIQIICESVQNGKMKTNLKGILEELSENKNQGVLTISFLRSSYITGTHEFYIAYYESEAFVEEEPAGVFYDMHLLFEGIEEDFLKIDYLLEKNFTRIILAEKEELHRLYMEQVYQNFWIIIELLLKDIPMRKGLPVYYGGFMEEQKMIVII